MERVEKDQWRLARQQKHKQYQDQTQQERAPKFQRELEVLRRQQREQQEADRQRLMLQPRKEQQRRIQKEQERCQREHEQAMD